jgi:hypothetical protein
MPKTTLTAAELQAAEQAAEALADRIYRLHQLANAGALLFIGDPNRPKGSAFRSWLERTEQFVGGHQGLLEKARDAVPLQSQPFRFEDRSARNVLAFLLETADAALDLLRTDAARAEPIPQPFCSMLNRRLGTSGRWDDLKHSLKYAFELIQVVTPDEADGGQEVKLQGAPVNATTRVARAGGRAGGLPDKPDSRFLTAKDLANHLQHNAKTVESFLCRLRKKDDTCYLPVENPCKNQPRHLYVTDKVRDALLERLPVWRARAGLKDG